MDLRQLGKSGITVSAVGLGGNNFGARIPLEETHRVLDAARECGVTLIDTADAYGRQFGMSEEALGEALAGRRNAFVLATKFAVNPLGFDKPPRTDAAYVEQAVEDSLRRLRTDVIDLYQMHFSSADVPISETLQALDRLVRAGKVRAIGCSNMDAAQIEEAARTAQELGITAFVTCQAEYSLLWRSAEDEVLPALRRQGMSLLPYFPLASGLLSGKYTPGAPPPPGSRAKAPGLVSKYDTPANHALIAGLEGFARDRGRSLLELAFAWLLAQPEVASVIAGCTSGDQVRANAAAGEWSLLADEKTAVQGLLDAG